MTMEATLTAASSRTPEPTAAPTEARTLTDLLYDGFYLIYLLRAGQLPPTAGTLREQVQSFLKDVEKNALKLGVAHGDLHLIKYAFCTTLDEVILRSDSPLRPEWQKKPLQLIYFGDQLGGERFFAQLEAARQEGADRQQVLEVFHMCLLMGFQGKYVFEGLDKLAFLTARLGDEIARLKGKRSGFAPRWAAPDQISHRLRSEFPLWVVCSIFGLVGLLAFLGLRLDLGRETQNQLAGYSRLIKVAPEPAHITITLP